MSNFMELDNKPSFPPLLCMVFDDGRESVYTQAYKYMRSKGVVGTVYINASSIDRRIGWKNLMIMRAHGWDVQDHGFRHSDFSTIGLQEATENLDATNTFFQNRGLQSPQHFAYPYNAIGHAELVQSQRKSFFDRSLWSEETQLNHYNDNPYQLIRTAGDIKTIEQLSTAKNLVDQTVAENKLMITNTHDVGWASDGNYADIEFFQEFVDYAIYAGITFVTITTAYKLMMRYRTENNRWRDDFVFVNYNNRAIYLNFSF